MEWSQIKGLRSIWDKLEEIELRVRVYYLWPKSEEQNRSLLPIRDYEHRHRVRGMPIRLDAICGQLYLHLEQKKLLEVERFGKYQEWVMYSPELQLFVPLGKLSVGQEWVKTQLPSSIWKITFAKGSLEDEDGKDGYHGDCAENELILA